MRFQYLLAALLITCATPAFAQLDWVFSYDDGDGNSQHSDSLPITTNPKNFHPVWEIQLTPSENDYHSIMSSLLIADNKILTSIAYYDNNDDSKSSNINAIDADTGKSLWTVYNPGFQLNSLTYQAGKIITVLDNPDDSESLTAYDIKSGQLLYAEPVDNDVSHLMSYGDAIYFSKGHHAIGSIDPNYGRINWVKPLQAGMYFSSSLSINSHYILTREFDNIRIYDIKNGAEIKKIWMPDSAGESSVYAAPIVDGNTAYAIFQSADNKAAGTLYAFDLNRKKIKWAVPNQSNEYAFVIDRSMLLTNGTIVSCAATNSSQNSDKFNFIDAKTGKVLWAWTIPAVDIQYPPYFMVATTDTVFIAGKSHVYAVSLTTRQTVWSIEKTADQLYLGAGKLFIKWHNDAKEHYLTAVALN